MPTDLDDADRELLARLAAAEPDAANELYSRYRIYLKRIAEARFDDRLRPRVDESDLVQEALTEAARSMPAYLTQRPMPFRLWLRQLLLDALLAAQRRHLGADCRAVGREVDLSDRSCFRAAQQLVDPNMTPGRQAQQRESADRVRSALARLDAADREVIVLRTFEQLSTREAADLIGITPEAVSKRLVRALAKLRSELAATSDSSAS